MESMVCVKKEAIVDLIRLKDEFDSVIESLELMADKDFMDSFKKAKQQIKDKDFVDWDEL